MPVIYHRPDYKEDLNGATMYQEVNKQQNRKTGNYLKAALLIFVLPYGLQVLRIVKDVPPYVFPFTFCGAFLLALTALLRQGNTLARYLQRCQRCNTKLRKEIQESNEFHVCHECKTFIRGINWE